VVVIRSCWIFALAVLCSTTVVGCSRLKSVALLTHRIGRLKNHHIYRPPADEPCMQSCAARERPRLFHREHHWMDQ